MSKSYKDEQKEVKIMDLKNYSTGVQHIGIPTNDIDKTVEFYHKLGLDHDSENCWQKLWE